MTLASIARALAAFGDALLGTPPAPLAWRPAVELDELVDELAELRLAQPAGWVDCR